MLQRDKNQRLMSMQAVAEALRSEEFPMDIKSISYIIGDYSLQNVRGEEIRVSELITQLEDKEYRSVEDVMKAIHNSLGFPVNRAA